MCYSTTNLTKMLYFQAGNEVRLTNGLYKSHAYSVTGIATVSIILYYQCGQNVYHHTLIIYLGFPFDMRTNITLHATLYYSHILSVKLLPF